MIYEKNKVYSFDRNDFSVSKETGRTFFLLNDDNSDYTMRIVPFKFQTVNTPDSLKCRYLGNGRWEQVKRDLVPRLYEEGGVYEFTVLHQMRNLQGSCVMSDDINGIRFSSVSMGNKRFREYQRIRCRVGYPKNENEEIILTPVEESPVNKSKFDSNKFLMLPSVRGFVRFFGNRLEKSDKWADAISRETDGDNEWLINMLVNICSHIPEWSRGRRRNLLKVLRAVIVEVIENSSYLEGFPLREIYQKKEVLENLATVCDEYLEALDLISYGTHTAFISTILSRLQTSGILFRAEHKFGVLKALFALGCDLSADAVEILLSLSKARHKETGFVRDHVPVFIPLLSEYVEKQSKGINPHDRRSLRLLIKTIAVELLLTENMEFPQWSRHRGLMYSSASLLGVCDESVLTEKSYLSLTGQLTESLEFSWKDIEDVNMLTSTKLALPVWKKENVSARFDGENSCVRIAAGQLLVESTVAGYNSRTAIRRTLGENIEASVTLHDRHSTEDNPDGKTVGRRVKLWSEAEAAIWNENFTVPVAPKTKKSAKLLLEPGDRVKIRITGQPEWDRLSCAVCSDVYQGYGILSIWDISLLPVKSVGLEMFMHEGKPMIFEATVKAVDEDGNYEFSLFRQSLDIHESRARTNYDSGDVIEGIVTGGNDKQAFLITESGYTAIYHCGKEIPKKNTVVCVYIRSVNRKLRDDKLYVNAYPAEGESYDMSEKEAESNIRDMFVSLIRSLWSGDVYEDVPDVISEPVEEFGEEEYLLADDVAALATLFETQSFLIRETPGISYDMLGFAALLAKMAADTEHVASITAKMAALESLDAFSVEGKVDEERLSRLEESASRLGIRDTDLNYLTGSIRLLSYLESDKSDSVLTAPSKNSEHDRLRSLILAYNIVSRYGVRGVRRELREEIFRIVGVKPSQEYISTIDRHEDELHEFKTSLVFPASNHMRPNEKAQGREICQIIDGMLNTDGGTLYIGVSNTGSHVGLHPDFVYLSKGRDDYDLADVKDKFELLFYNDMRFNIGLLCGGRLLREFIDFRWEERDRQHIAVITVTPFPGVVRMSDGLVFVRQGSSTEPIRASAAIDDYERQRLSRFS